MLSTSPHATVAGKRFSIGNRRSLKSRATKVTVIFLLFFGFLAITNFRFSGYETAGHNDQEMFIPIDYSKTNTQKSDTPASAKTEREIEAVNERNHDEVSQQQDEEASVLSRTTNERNVATETNNGSLVLEDQVEKQSHVGENVENLSTSTTASNAISDFPPHEQLTVEEIKPDKDNEIALADESTVHPQVVTNDENSPLTTNSESAVPETKQIGEVSGHESSEENDTSTSSTLLQNESSFNESDDNQAVVKEDDNTNKTGDSPEEQNTTHDPTTVPGNEESSFVAQEKEPVNISLDQTPTSSNEHDTSQSSFTSSVIHEQKVSDIEPGNENERDNIQNDDKPKIVQPAWPEPFQPIRDPNRRFTARSLEDVFDIGLLRYSYVHPLLKEKMKYYNISSDNLFKEFEAKGELLSLAKMFMPYVLEEAQRTWTQFKEYDPGYYVKHTGNTSKGYGLFSDRNMEPNVIIGEYTGDLILNEHLVDSQYAWAVPEMILWDQPTRDWIPVKVSLDSSRRGNLLRFANDLGHGTWNLAPHWVPVNNKWRLYYVTTRAIAAGEELSIQYGNSYWERGLNSPSSDEEVHLNTSDGNAEQFMHTGYRKVALMKKHLKQAEVFPTNVEILQNAGVNENAGERTTALPSNSVQDAVVEGVEMQPDTNTDQEIPNEYIHHNSISNNVHPHSEEQQIPTESTTQQNFEDQNAPLHSIDQEDATKNLDSATAPVLEGHSIPQANEANDISSNSIETRSDLVENIVPEQADHLESSVQENLSQQQRPIISTVETPYEHQQEIMQQTVPNIVAHQSEINNLSNEEHEQGSFKTQEIINTDTLGTPEVSIQHSETDFSTINPTTSMATQFIEGSIDTSDTAEEIIQTEAADTEQQKNDPGAIPTNVNENLEGPVEDNENVTPQNVILDHQQQETNVDIMDTTKQVTAESNTDLTNDIGPAEIVPIANDPSNYSVGHEDVVNERLETFTTGTHEEIGRVMPEQNKN